MRKIWRPKFNVGDHVRFSGIVSARSLEGTGFLKGDDLEIVNRMVRARAGDRRPNRYRVVSPTGAGTGKDGWASHQGWFYEDDLELA
jgi:hypothetical protein